MKQQADVSSFPVQVEKLLDNHMQEIGINEQQFVEAYTSPFAKSKTLQVHFVRVCDCLPACKC